MEKNVSEMGSVDCLPSQTRSTITLDVDSKKDEEYNPLEHRQVEHPTSTLGSFFHLLKSSLGSGILSMPAAFKHTGIIPGCIGTVIVGFIATHCVHILVTTSRDICKECHVASLSYTTTCERVFKNGPKRTRPYSTFVRHFVDYAMAGVCLGGTSVYVIFIASSLKSIFDNYASDTKYPVEAYCGFLLLPLILITQLRHLKFLVPFSLLANLSLVVTFGITCFYTFSGLPDLSKVKLVNSVAQWPLFLSTAIFAMEGINVVMPIENEMANPEDFLGCPGVLNITMTLVAALYGVVGLFGYLKYGEGVDANLIVSLPKDDLSTPAVYSLLQKKERLTYIMKHK
ncbi:proton-coupled amino acid transporter-like protein CG1139 [Pectinophora gossypiella]|uniref:proton-coupled amino acid transporter-like protein CG1139 n=1 Tax=Pectinophora gossypiella TaxID=13191 RepID=UPI00214E9EF1|nr:proton-coupled amino acid transporter-like protein CG1139 [Pectinophora gossypiella]